MSPKRLIWDEDNKLVFLDQEVTATLRKVIVTIQAEYQLPDGTLHEEPGQVVVLKAGDSLSLNIDEKEQV
jgi:Cft2 family RNA processing exonuclease